MRVLEMILLAAALMTVVLGQYQGQQQQQQQQQQQLQQDEQYGEYDDRQRPLHPTPRSYGTGNNGVSSDRRQQASAGEAPKPTAPVAILKQINRHNEDGSYTYGFEGGDGSFKIETKLANGEVKGKYGFVDDTGKVRVVEYGANQYGFQPAGEGITVAPPTLIDETTNKDSQNYQDYDLPQQNQQQQQQKPAQRPYQRYEEPTQSHTQAIYDPQLARNRQPSAPKPPAVFAPASQGSSHNTQQSQLLRPGYPIQEPAPASQAFNQGPVQFSPAPVQERSQQQAATPNRSPTRPVPSPSGGILDQLARDYALPQGGSAPLHDISFGYY